MESISFSLLEKLGHTVKLQEAALTSLAEVLTQEVEHVRTHDQIRCLQDLKASVMEQVEWLKLEEPIAEDVYGDRRLKNSLGKFALGVIGAFFSHSQEHPLSVGARLLEQELARENCFGNIKVAIGASGIPDGVRAVSLSYLARQQGKTEEEVVTSLGKSGFKVLSPEEFSKLLDQLEWQILQGSLNLPATLEAPRKPRIVFKPRGVIPKKGIGCDS
ncbi:hypothetical protein ACFLWX_02350 [Chloroflexota bacterium]